MERDYRLNEGGSHWAHPMGPRPHLYEAGEPVIDADDWLAELAKCPKEAARLRLEHEKAQAAGETGAWFKLLD